MDLLTSPKFLKQEDPTSLEIKFEKPVMLRITSNYFHKIFVDFLKSISLQVMMLMKIKLPIVRCIEIYKNRNHHNRKICHNCCYCNAKNNMFDLHNNWSGCLLVTNDLKFDNTRLHNVVTYQSVVAFLTKTVLGCQTTERNSEEKGKLCGCMYIFYLVSIYFTLKRRPLSYYTTVFVAFRSNLLELSSFKKR